MELEIKKYGCNVLRKRSVSIEEIDDELLELIEAMKKKMFESDGIGLAAPQVGINKRLVVVSVGSDEEKNAIALINPQIVWKSVDVWELEEGCLSLPGIIANVVRPLKIKVTFFNEQGEELLLECDEMLARCIQHEIDHLDGILFIDKVKPAELVKWNKLLKKIKSEGEKQNA
jgi:peptide deformylase